MKRLFPWKSPSKVSEESLWYRSLTVDGVRISKERGADAVPLAEVFGDGLIAQLADDGYAQSEGADTQIAWDALYAALEDGAYPSLGQQLALPPVTARTICLRSSGSLTDPGFAIAIDGFKGATGRSEYPMLLGPVLRLGGGDELMTPEQWRLVRAVGDFSRAGVNGRTPEVNRRGWGEIRRLARKARAATDDFLYRSVVLAPERLQLNLREAKLAHGDRVIEIEPSFEEAPEGWLQHFDAAPEAKELYEIVTPEGIVQVVTTPAVRAVLGELKRMPYRRVAGARAEAFLANPFALLGEAASYVIDEAQLAQAKEEAGLRYERFAPAIEYDAEGYPTRVGLLIEAGTSEGLNESECVWLGDKELVAFLEKAEESIAAGLQMVAWRGYDLEIQGETPRHLAELRDAYEQRRYRSLLVSYEQVHDLSAYSPRIEGIGHQKPLYSPYIGLNPDGNDWFAEETAHLLKLEPRVAGEASLHALSAEEVEALKEAVAAAEAKGEKTVAAPFLPADMPIEEAKDALEAWQRADDDIKERRFKGKLDESAEQLKKGKRKSLLVKANIDGVTYEEARRLALVQVPSQPTIPKALQAEHRLLDHQLHGVAWLQHLFGERDRYQVRGAVLADDMGLGKTLQLLTFMTSALEAEPDIAPMLVVAPVALLENWQEEVQKFFEPNALPMLVAYGNSLAELRASRGEIDARLQKEGLDKFLRPKWVGDAKLVLTTYETLRDFEFSFALQKWSIMVCDEAQKIKNPAAMVTRAAKKQNVNFRVACTGTPVENSLTDLWCLFDFVQPGLLGALNSFGQEYRRPIEAKTEEQKAKVEELRALIAPQILRRRKDEVVKDLPGKHEDPSCKSLAMSSHQRALYVGAITSFKEASSSGAVSPFKNHLGLLQYLRLVSTDPQAYGQSVFTAEDVKAYRAKAPKLDWLLKQLAEIRRRNEKAIIFCEFREMQRLLQHYIREVFGHSADVINGDTTAAGSSADSRQKRIRRFQEAPGFGVIILSPLAVGFGVNIQAANHVIHYTRTWNPAKEDQATDRAYRIGQKKDVMVYCPVVTAEFDTFDVVLDRLLSRKRELAKDMLNGAGDVQASEFRVEDCVPENEKAGLDRVITKADLLAMEPLRFELLVGALWAKQGYVCKLTPKSNDKGIDVVAVRGAQGVLIQVKSSGKQGNELGPDAVKEVVAGAPFYRKQLKSTALRLACVTNQRFSESASSYARVNEVQLFQQGELVELLQQWPIWVSELDAAAASGTFVAAPAGKSTAA